MNRSEILQRIRDLGVIPVVRAASADEAIQVVEAIRAGGVSLLEITMTVPGAVQVIEKLAQRFGEDAIVGAGIGSLFAVNTVTGVWNLIEARKDSVGRKRRLTHGLLMMAADAGFFATFLAAPDDEEGNFSDSRSTHRTIAITSIGTPFSASAENTVR